MASPTSMTSPPSRVSISSASTMTAAVGPLISFSSSSTPDSDMPNPKRSSLRTPLSATYPSSSLYSPMTDLKREEASHTPLTPPPAYLDFLKNFPPSLTSPAPSSATSVAFSFTGSGFKTPNSAYSTNGDYKFASAHPQLPAAARPVLLSNPSTASSGSMASATSAASGISAVSAPASIQPNPSHPVSTPSVAACPNPAAASPPHPPLSAPPRPSSTFESPTQPPARRLSQPQRRPTLSIPPSPSLRSPSVLSPASILSPTSIRSPSIRSPPSASVPGTHSPGSAVSSPAGGFERGKMRQVSVKQVVTRTYTYTWGSGGAITDVAGDAGRGSGADGGVVEERGNVGDGGAAGGSTSEEGDIIGEVERLAPQTTPLVGDVPKGKRRRVD